MTKNVINYCHVSKMPAITKVASIARSMELSNDYVVVSLPRIFRKLKIKTCRAGPE